MAHYPQSDGVEFRISLSALQHYAYCPRQCALIHVEHVWAENALTAEGRILHERVDRGVPESRSEIRYERSVEVCSERLGLVGKLDLLEIDAVRGVKPIEYKRGKPKTEDWDRIQLCGQALCLEEMLNLEVNQGALWYWQTRHREAVDLDSHLREATLRAVDGVRGLLADTMLPAVTVPRSRCRSCSLRDLCQPEVLRRDQSERYCQELFNCEETAE